MSFTSAAKADLVLETETAQLGKKGTFATSAAFQMEKSSDGSTHFFTLNQFEYALTDRAEILIEPFFYDVSRPIGEATTRGMGDLEITPSYMIFEETKDTPAIVLAFKVKVPTATNRDIGSGKFDYQPFIIIGKTYGPLIVNFNLGYDFITPTSDERLRDQFNADISVEYVIVPEWSVYAETFVNSSPVAGERGTVSFAIATEYRFTEHVNAFVSIGDDTDQVANVRFGMNFEW